MSAKKKNVKEEVIDEKNSKKAKQQIDLLIFALLNNKNKINPGNMTSIDALLEKKLLIEVTSKNVNNIFKKNVSSKKIVKLTF